MEVTYGGVVEYDSKRAQVDFSRTKRHYYEKYNYGQSMAPGDVEVVRRSVPWMIVCLFRRGIFEAQWAGMGADARAAANTARASLAGYAGGMPLGALASAETAVRQIVHEGATAYALEVQDEPFFFVEFNSNAGVFLPKEMHSEAVGRLYGEVSVVLGLDPSQSGSYSGRRKHAVAVRKQCETRGMPIELAKKSMAHKTTHGTMTKVYDDDLASEDMMGALSGGGVRPREAIESLRSLLVTRVPAAGKLRTFADIKKNDPIRVAFLDNNEKVVGCKLAIAALNATAGPGVDDSALRGARRDRRG